MSDEILRFGIQFADGSKASSLRPPMIGPTDKTKKGPRAAARWGRIWRSGRGNDILGMAASPGGSSGLRLRVAKIPNSIDPKGNRCRPHSRCSEARDRALARRGARGRRTPRVVRIRRLRVAAVAQACPKTPPAGRKSEATPRLRTAVGLDVPDQLRMYTIKPGAMAAWLEEWRRLIAPLRRRHGFEILGAWTTEPDKFVWILRYAGSKTWDEADAT